MEGYVFEEADFEADDDDTESPIVKTKQFAVKPMHVEEAALQMELCRGRLK